MTEQAAPGWYPDQQGHPRYWNGTQWAATAQPQVVHVKKAPPSKAAQYGSLIFLAILVAFVVFMVAYR